MHYVLWPFYSEGITAENLFPNFKVCVQRMKCDLSDANFNCWEHFHQSSRKRNKQQLKQRMKKDGDWPGYELLINSAEPLMLKRKLEETAMFLKGGKGETNRYWKYFTTYKNKQSRFKGESEKIHKQSCKRLKKAAITSYSLHYCLEVHLSFSISYRNDFRCMTKGTLASKSGKEKNKNRVILASPSSCNQHSNGGIVQWCLSFYSKPESRSVKSLINIKWLENTVQHNTHEHKNVLLPKWIPTTFSTC